MRKSKRNSVIKKNSNSSTSNWNVIEGLKPFRQKVDSGHSRSVTCCATFVLTADVFDNITGQFVEPVKDDIHSKVRILVATGDERGEIRLRFFDTRSMLLTQSFQIVGSSSDKPLKNKTSSEYAGVREASLVKTKDSIENRHSSFIFDVIFVYTNNQLSLVSCSSDGTIRQWNINKALSHRLFNRDFCREEATKIILQEVLVVPMTIIGNVVHEYAIKELKYLHFSYEYENSFFSFDMLSVGCNDNTVRLFDMNNSGKDNAVFVTNYYPNPKQGYENFFYFEDSILSGHHDWVTSALMFTPESYKTTTKQFFPQNTMKRRGNMKPLVVISGGFDSHIYIWYLAVLDESVVNGRMGGYFEMGQLNSNVLFGAGSKSYEPRSSKDCYDVAVTHHNDIVSSIALVEQEEPIICSGDDSGVIYLWSLASPEIVIRKFDIRALSMSATIPGSPNSNTDFGISEILIHDVGHGVAPLLISSSNDGKIRLFCIPTGELVRELPGHNCAGIRMSKAGLGSVGSVILSNNLNKSNKLNSMGQYLEMLAVANGKKVPSPSIAERLNEFGRDHNPMIATLINQSLSYFEPTVFSVENCSSSLFVWNFHGKEDMTEINFKTTMDGHSMSINSICYVTQFPDLSPILCTASNDCAVRLYSLSKKSDEKEFLCMLVDLSLTKMENCAHAAGVNVVLCLEVGGHVYLITCGDDTFVKIWRLEVVKADQKSKVEARLIFSQDCHISEINAMTIFYPYLSSSAESNNDESSPSATTDASVSPSDVSVVVPNSPVNKLKSAVKNLRKSRLLSPRKPYLVTGSTDRTLKCWDILEMIEKGETQYDIVSKMKKSQLNLNSTASNISNPNSNGSSPRSEKGKSEKNPLQLNQENGGRVAPVVTLKGHEEIVCDLVAIDGSPSRCPLLISRGMYGELLIWKFDLNPLKSIDCTSFSYKLEESSGMTLIDFKSVPMSSIYQNDKLAQVIPSVSDSAEYIDDVWICSAAICDSNQDDGFEVWNPWVRSGFLDNASMIKQVNEASKGVKTPKRHDKIHPSVMSTFVLKYAKKYFTSFSYFIVPGCLTSSPVVMNTSHPYNNNCTVVIAAGNTTGIIEYFALHRHKLVPLKLEDMVRYLSSIPNQTSSSIKAMLDTSASTARNSTSDNMLTNGGEENQEEEEEDDDDENDDSSVSSILIYATKDDVYLTKGTQQSTVRVYDLANSKLLGHTKASLKILAHFARRDGSVVSFALFRMPASCRDDFTTKSRKLVSEMIKNTGGEKSADERSFTVEDYQWLTGTYLLSASDDNVLHLVDNFHRREIPLRIDQHHHSTDAGMGTAKDEDVGQTMFENPYDLQLYNLFQFHKSVDYQSLCGQKRPFLLVAGKNKTKNIGLYGMTYVPTEPKLADSPTTKSLTVNTNIRSLELPLENIYKRNCPFRFQLMTVFANEFTAKSTIGMQFYNPRLRQIASYIKESQKRGFDPNESTIEDCRLEKPLLVLVDEFGIITVCDIEKALEKSSNSNRAGADDYSEAMMLIPEVALAVNGPSLKNYFTGAPTTEEGKEEVKPSALDKECLFNCIDIDPVHNLLIMGCAKGYPLLFELDNRQLLDKKIEYGNAKLGTSAATEIKCHSMGITVITTYWKNKKSLMIVTGSKDKTVIVWEFDGDLKKVAGPIDMQSPISSISLFSGPVHGFESSYSSSADTSVAPGSRFFSHSGHQASVYMGSDANYFTKSKKFDIFNLLPNYVPIAAMSYLIVGCEDGSIFLCDLMGTKIRSFESHRAMVSTTSSSSTPTLNYIQKCKVYTGIQFDPVMISFSEGAKGAGNHGLQYHDMYFGLTDSQPTYRSVVSMFERDIAELRVARKKTSGTSLPSKFLAYPRVTALSKKYRSFFVECCRLFYDALSRKCVDFLDIFLKKYMDAVLVRQYASKTCTVHVLKKNSLLNSSSRNIGTVVDDSNVAAKAPKKVASDLELYDIYMVKSAQEIKDKSLLSMVNCCFKNEKDGQMGVEMTSADQSGVTDYTIKEQDLKVNVTISLLRHGLMNNDIDCINAVVTGLISRLTDTIDDNSDCYEQYYPPGSRLSDADVLDLSSTFPREFIKFITSLKLLKCHSITSYENDIKIYGIEKDKYIMTAINSSGCVGGLWFQSEESKAEALKRFNIKNGKESGSKSKKKKSDDDEDNRDDDDIIEYRDFGREQFSSIRSIGYEFYRKFGNMLGRDIPPMPLDKKDLGNPQWMVPVFSPLPHIASFDMLEAFVEASSSMNDVSIFNSDLGIYGLRFAWRNFGRSIHLKAIVWHMIYAFFYSFSLFCFNDWSQGVSISDGIPSGLSSGDVVRFIVAWALQFVQLLLTANFIYREYLQFIQQGEGNIIEHLSDFWNCNDILLYVTVIVGVVFRIIHGEDHYSRAFLSLAGVSMYMKILYYLRAFESTGPLVSMIFTIAYDIRYVMLVLMIVIIGFAQSFWILSMQDGTLPFGIFKFAMLNLFDYMLGNFSSDFTGTASPNLGVVLYIVFMFIVAILILNLIIALMGDSFARVNANGIAQWRLEQAMIVVEQECLAPESPVDDYRMPTQNPRFLHLLLRMSDIGNQGNSQEDQIAELDEKIQRQELKMEKMLNMMLASPMFKDEEEDDDEEDEEDEEEGDEEDDDEESWNEDEEDYDDDGYLEDYYENEYSQQDEYNEGGQEEYYHGQQGDDGYYEGGEEEEEEEDDDEEEY